MHICCANCALYPIETVRRKGIDVQGFWYNPNIHPFKEYESRLDSVNKLKDSLDIEVEVKDCYGLVEFIRRVAYNEHHRCRYCYNIRLEETARQARQMQMDAFTTSLLVSIYQDTERIIQTGMMMSARYDIEFYIEDFKRGFYEGRRRGREMGFYQQKYCGCIYSEMERYLGLKG